ncbi:MAG: hypothetical protein KME03_09675 [Aphanocapsa lilacina HA4352-LM1]|jgi:hypothetical protein|nr:hypothetical protein [Aphanocapsa lilacina HA4352-LM1]
MISKWFAFATCLLSGLFSLTVAASADPAVCPAGTRANITFASGNLACAIAPSTTDPAIADRVSGQTGYGYHAVALPTKLEDLKGVLVFLLASNSRPYNPISGKYMSANILDEGASAGLLVLQLAYANSTSIGSLCGEDPDCYGPARREVVYGEAVSPVVAVDYPNSLINRLERLVAYLKVNLPPEVRLPEAIGGKVIDWSKLLLGGHSQGGGHAGLLAQAFGVANVCYLSSIVDAVVDGDGYASASWITTPFVTPVSAMRAVVHQIDTQAPKILTNFATLSLSASAGTTASDNGYLTLTNKPMGSSHGATAKDPQYAAERRWACYQPAG